MNLRFYRVESEFCTFLRQADPRIPYVQDGKNTRPFVGILISVNGLDYFAPLTSPKQKHKTMKNQVDFLKINDGVWGAINLNNMIPIHKDCLNVVDLTIRDTDTAEEIAYKNLLSNQLSWCNSNKEDILKRALKLHRLVITGRAWPELLNRCCNFLIDEEKCRMWHEKQT
jgi:protein AbiQ